MTSLGLEKANGNVDGRERFFGTVGRVAYRVTNSAGCLIDKKYKHSAGNGSFLGGKKGSFEENDRLCIG